MRHVLTLETALNSKTSSSGRGGGIIKARPCVLNLMILDRLQCLFLRGIINTASTYMSHVLAKTLALPS